MSNFVGIRITNCDFDARSSDKIANFNARSQHKNKQESCLHPIIDCVIINSLLTVEMSTRAWSGVCPNWWWCTSGWLWTGGAISRTVASFFGRYWRTLCYFLMQWSWFKWLRPLINGCNCNKRTFQFFHYIQPVIIDVEEVMVHFSRFEMLQHSRSHN